MIQMKSKHDACINYIAGSHNVIKINFMHLPCRGNHSCKLPLHVGYLCAFNKRLLIIIVPVPIRCVSKHLRVVV